MRITVSALIDELLKCAPKAEIEFFVAHQDRGPVVALGNSVQRVDNIGAHHVRIFLQKSA